MRVLSSVTESSDNWPRMGSHRPPTPNVSSTLYQRILQFQALSSLHQQGNDVRKFALRFSGAAEGLGYNDATLKDLFNSDFEEPLNWWRMVAEPAPVREPTESAREPAPGAHRVRSRAHSAPEAHRVRSAPGAHRVRSAPGAHKIRSTPGAHRVRYGPAAHRVRPGPGAHRLACCLFLVLCALLSIVFFYIVYISSWSANISVKLLVGRSYFPFSNRQISQD